MSTPPADPKIFHITHVDNLASIIADGGIQSDARMLIRGGPSAAIGISSIKANRLKLPVKCFSGERVGDYVPFNFCPRSVMLYILHRANNPALTYKGGQEPIVHLRAGLHNVVAWANTHGCRWAFSLSNAGAAYTEFRSDVNNLDDLDWNAIASPDFRNADAKEKKQAEFLVKDSLPWHLVEHIGVFSNRYKRQVEGIIANAAHQPVVSVHQNWYF